VGKQTGKRRIVWLPTKKGVRFLKRDVKVLVEALAKNL
jgi:hypothetical protein